jgi:hypothetical protein
MIFPQDIGSGYLAYHLIASWLFYLLPMKVPPVAVLSIDFDMGLRVG